MVPSSRVELEREDQCLHVALMCVSARVDLGKFITRSVKQSFIIFYNLCIHHLSLEHIMQYASSFGYNISAHTNIELVSLKVIA